MTVPYGAMSRRRERVASILLAAQALGLSVRYNPNAGTGRFEMKQSDVRQFVDIYAAVHGGDEPRPWSHGNEPPWVWYYYVNGGLDG